MSGPEGDGKPLGVGVGWGSKLQSPHWAASPRASGEEDPDPEVGMERGVAGSPFGPRTETGILSRRSQEDEHHALQGSQGSALHPEPHAWPSGASSLL